MKVSIIRFVFKGRVALNLGFLFVLVTLPSMGLTLVEHRKTKRKPEEHKLYTATNSSEAEMIFSHWVEINTRRKPSRSTAELQIEKQLTYMFGSMGSSKYPGVPKGDHVVTLRNIEPDSNRQDVFKIFYSYRGTVVLKNGPTLEYTVVLPNNPDLIYKQGLLNTRDSSGKVVYTKPCTDIHYDSEVDFWYFWNPKNFNCPLKEHDHYAVVKTRIKRMPNVSSSYPDYPRLLRKENDEWVIPIIIFLGMDDNEKNDLDPNKSVDINATTYLNIKRSLLQKGFKLTSAGNALKTHPAIQRMPRSKTPYGFLESLSKQIVQTPLKQPINIKIDLYFGPTGISEKSHTFHYLFKYALENMSVFLYDGHSGLGGNLDLVLIEDSLKSKINIPKDQYQIYFFNSCSSYPYYNTMYFKRKISHEDSKGWKNLDILTNGLATYFSVLSHTSLALVEAIELWASDKKIISYQAIARAIDSDNLFGINGDEDNPKTEREVYENLVNFN